MAFFTRKDFLGQWRPAAGFSLILFWVFFVLYSTVLGSTHLARYIIFVMPLLALVATVGGKWLWERNEMRGWNRSRFIQVAGMIAVPLVLLAVFGAETSIRLGLDSQSSLSRSMNAVSEREEFTQELLDRLGVDGSETVSVALQEVQLRYWLDERIVVRSLDGRMDPILLDHANSTGVDHLGYLRERNVEFLLDLPNYNRDKAAWSLAQLYALSPGESTKKEGLSFTSLVADGPPAENSGAESNNSCRAGPPLNRPLTCNGLQR